MANRKRLTHHLIVMVGCLLIQGFMAAPRPLMAQARPSVAVVGFEIKAPGARYELGNGMSDMLVNALVETGRFNVVERSQIEKLLNEQGMALEGLLQPGTGAQVGRMLGAQYLILGSVIKFEEKEKSVGFGPHRVRRTTAKVGINIRVIDATKGVIHDVKSIDKKSSTTGISSGTTHIQGIGSQAMQDVLEEAIEEAVAQLSAELKPVPGLSSSVGSGDHSAASAAAPPDCSSMSGATGPRVMVVIPEEHIQRRIPDPAGETEIIRKFLEAGLNLVDQQQIDAIRDQERVLHAVNDPSVAASLGAEFGADYIVIGEAFSEFASQRNNMISCRARVEARVIETRTGRIIAADGQHGSGLDIAENVAAKAALRNAGSSLADYFLGRMCGQAVGNPSARTVEVLFPGISFGELQRVSSALEAVADVQGVKKSLTGDVGRLQVQYAGGTEDLANALMNMQSLSLEIVGFSDNKLEAKVVN